MLAEAASRKFARPLSRLVDGRAVLGAFKGASRRAEDGAMARCARSSMPLNLREGSHGRGESRTNRYSFVAGSADEVIALIDTGVACGYFRAMPELSEKLRKIVGTMVKCMRK